MVRLLALATFALASLATTIKADFVLRLPELPTALPANATGTNLEDADFEDIQGYQTMGRSQVMAFLSVFCKACR